MGYEISSKGYRVSNNR